MSKVIIAYSGGLYSSILLHWLKHKKGYEVVAFTGKLGGEKQIVDLQGKALSLGACEVVVADLLEDFVDGYIFPTLRANAKYESRYMFSTALSRPLILKEMVKSAIELDCDFLAHGCDPSANDSMRFATILASLAPDIEIISPWKRWGLNTFEEIQRYTKRHNLNLVAQKDSNRIDENIWGRSIKIKKLEGNSWNNPKEDTFTLTVDPTLAPDQPLEVEIEFQEGTPIALNGSKENGISLIEKLNQMGGTNGIGRIVGLENMLTGTKSREFYESPAADILYTAHQTLEELTLSKNLIRFKEIASKYYAKLIYQGLWFSELREALDCFFQNTQHYVSGIVKLKLYKGNCTVLECKSPHSLFQRRGSSAESSTRATPPPVEFTQIPLLLQESMQGESTYIEE